MDEQQKESKEEQIKMQVLIERRKRSHERKNKWLKEILQLLEVDEWLRDYIISEMTSLQDDYYYILSKFNEVSV
ncbi:MAG: hypothetical protein MUP41_07890 [Desulfobacterales bacterium]|nr:hypothetical protein [Desulfobacterales bacterium]